MQLHQHIVAQQNTVQKRAVVQPVHQVRDNILTNYLVPKSLIWNVILLVLSWFWIMFFALWTLASSSGRACLI